MQMSGFCGPVPPAGGRRRRKCLGVAGSDQHESQAQKQAQEHETRQPLTGNGTWSQVPPQPCPPHPVNASHSVCSRSCFSVRSRAGLLNFVEQTKIEHRPAAR